MEQLLDNEQFLTKIGINVRLNSPSLQEQRSWQNITITDLESDPGLLVTHVNQTQDLLRLNTVLPHPVLKSTDEWLQSNRLETLQLTLEDLIKRGNLTLNDKDATEQIEFTTSAVQDFESQLHEAIELYDQRIQWLLQDSKKVFGVIHGSKTGVLVDASDMSCEPRLHDFQKDLLCLIDEQLCYMKQLYLISFGTEVASLWEKPRPVNVNRLHEARQWVQGLKPSGGCNLLKALKKVLVLQELNSLVIIVGSCPDQSAELLSDFIQQCTLGRILLIHTVAYECSSQVPPAVLKCVAQDVGGTYHSCSTTYESYDSSDLHLLRCERQKASDLLSIIGEIFQGRMGSSLFRLAQDNATEFGKYPHAVLPKPPKHDGPLVIQAPNVLAKTSAEWLKTNGLKAKKLSLYQVLAPNAFSPVEEFVPILQKTVSSTLHEKAMMQMDWYDGTVKNIHVDPPILYNYQALTVDTEFFKSRAEANATEAARQDGLAYQHELQTRLAEHRIVILLDVSTTNSMYIIHIQHSLRLLLEEQICGTDFFNIIAFGTDIQAWRPGMVPAHSDHLQRAWRWALTLQCEGTRNVMNALRRAVEVEFKEKDKQKSQGIYLLTTGVPDQEIHIMHSYMAEACAGCDLQLHICLFSTEAAFLDDNIPPRYASPNETASVFKGIVQAANGRFHWFGKTGIYESDDINVLVAEVEKAVIYSHRCAFLVESLKQRSGSPLTTHSGPEDLAALGKREKRPAKLPSPKQTALSLARMSIRDNRDRDKDAHMKAPSWRPTSAKAEIPPAQPIKGILQASRKKKRKPKAHPDVSLSLFYTEKGKTVGSIYRKYARPKCVWKSIPSVILPQEEEACSSEQWLSKFSIRKLKLELPRILFGPQCVHQKQMVESLHKKVAAKYCDIFPSVEMDGIVKHLHVQLKDLEDYIERLETLLRRYVQRIQWLLSGSRRLFGVILEAKVCILIDTSGSMDPSLSEVTTELTSLIWEQLRKRNTKFNLIRFAEDVEAWQECLVEATDEWCHDAVLWASSFQAHGNTSILKGLQRASRLQGVEALYVLTDGKPDTSCSLILKEIEMLVKKQPVVIHTISFNCSDRGANEFLKILASQTGGRYHRCHGDTDGQLAAHRMLTKGFDDEDDPVFPLFEGDDLKKLAEEISKARKYLIQAKFFRSLLEKKNLDQKDCSS